MVTARSLPCALPTLLPRPARSVCPLLRPGPRPPRPTTQTLGRKHSADNLQTSEDSAVLLWILFLPS